MFLLHTRRSVSLILFPAVGSVGVVGMVLRKQKLLFLNLFLLMRSHTGLQMCVDGKVDSQLVLGTEWECDCLDSGT